MVEVITIVLDKLRGGGFLLEPRSVSDFTRDNCDLIAREDTIDDTVTTVFRISNGTMEGYSVSEIMHLISGNLIKNLTFNNNQIRFDSYDPSEITTMDDLNGVIVGLRFEDNTIWYDTFESDNGLLYDSDLAVLSNAVTNLRYDTANYCILYDKVGEINE